MFFWLVVVLFITIAEGVANIAELQGALVFNAEYVMVKLAVVK